MKMRDALLHFLKALEEELPPDVGCHHSITFNQYGSDFEGWKDQLGLHIVKDGTFQTFFLDDGDLENAEKTINSIVEARKVT